MRLIDADELIEHAWRDKLDSRELIAKMIEQAPTVKEIPTKIPIDIFEKLVSREPCDVPDINDGDMISRQAAIDAANKVIERDTSGNNDVVNAMIAWSAYIKSLPSVAPQPKTGHYVNNQNGTFECSECGIRHSKSNYCPNCGCAMVEPQESEEV